MNDIRTLHTPRLVLSVPTEDDVHAHFEIHGDPETNRYNPSGPETSIDGSRRSVARYINDWERDGIGFHAVRIAAEPRAGQAVDGPGAGEVIGFTGLCRLIVGGAAILNLYYRYRPSTWGHGYAFEAAKAELEAFRGTSCAGLPVIAVIREANTASRRLAERLGLHWEPGHFDTEGRCVYELPDQG